MALVSLFVKIMFNVPSYFFMHTDWLDFIKHTTDLNKHELDRIRRLMRAFYKRFDGIFVLNSDHREWLIGHEMQIDEDKVLLTAHHTPPQLPNIVPIPKSELFDDATDDTPMLFIACRLSNEKGIFDLPDIVSRVRQSIPNLKIVVAGSGPVEKELKRRLPDALFLGWLDKPTIARYYRSLDLFVFPSRFDTFGNVLLEAFVYGMPAIAYSCKGPKDIIEHNVSGYLVENIKEMSDQIVEHFSSATNRKRFSHNATRRAAEYQAEPIMSQFMVDMGLAEPQVSIGQRIVA
jgi:glycosyltransferase involved in cell wall biosynthesis